MRVIERHSRERGHLRREVDASVDQPNCTKAQRDGTLGSVDAAACNLLVLRLEEVGKCRTIVAAVGLGPEAELVVLGLVNGESNDRSTARKRHR